MYNSFFSKLTPLKTSIKFSFATTLTVEAIRYYYSKKLMVNAKNNTINVQQKKIVLHTFNEMGINTYKYKMIFNESDGNEPFSIEPVLFSKTILFFLPKQHHNKNSISHKQFLQAVAAHEAVHNKERHNLLLKYTAFTSGSLVYNLLKFSCRASLPITLLSGVTTYFLIKSSVSQMLEKRADIIAAKKLNISSDLITICKAYEYLDPKTKTSRLISKLFGSHPLFSQRINYLKKIKSTKKHDEKNDTKKSIMLTCYS